MLIFGKQMQVYLYTVLTIKLYFNLNFTNRGNSKYEQYYYKCPNLQGDLQVNQ